MSRKVKFITIGAIVLLIAGMALYPVVKKWLTSDEIPSAPPTERQQRNALHVNAEILEHQSLDEVFRATGLLIPDEEVDLAFETSGKITNIYFQEGTHVKKGDLLAKVNDKPLQAELKKLEAQVPLAQDRVKRQETLLARDAVSQESYESVATDLETLMADIELVKARIAQTELRAPFDGMIGLRLVSEGAYASPTTIITRLTKMAPLKIDFSVNESQANFINPGTQLTFTVDNDRNVYRATVYAVESRLDQNTLTLMARALFDNPGGRLRPGHSASVEVNLKRFESTIAIPSLSTVAEYGRDIAYVYENGYAKQVEITKGLRTETSVQVTSGLYPGDTLITTGVMQLRNGMPVVLTDLKEPGREY
ncbi:MAG: efflux RND transporter periplasmic adaptor subunit [Alistipes sp.]|nr:efflux RND transporter periplasmic adaptor subunit [Alistipes sp.]